MSITVLAILIANVLAIGGTIGTGIFLSAGSVSGTALVLHMHSCFVYSKAIALAGPGSSLLSYVVVGLFVYSVVITL